LLVLGDRGAGKSTVIRVLQDFAAANEVALDVAEGLPTGLSREQRAHLASAVPLVVWDTGGGDDRGSLKDYVARHVKQLTLALSGSTKEREAVVARLLVLCNKSDIQPCPLPEIDALDPGTMTLAGSALRGTNMLTLWRRVETCAAPRPREHNLRPRVQALQLERSVSLDERSNELRGVHVEGDGW